ncbi:Trafficking protein particle complex subunit 10 [Armadillidium nasatum]|uniref:Trafficking protein particle complex subunit 10 n=1 Tax=Armadillidium nasatum TaxID=96803 RepID=A0A5N5TCA8_9CRUS|nr:Trafficking protein particle complex subunit 10 [Armadillidium nasatum]
MSKHLKHPYVTYSGDHNLFSSLQSGLTSALPQESVEWRRSFGRPTRCVHVDVDFVPYSEDLLTNINTIYQDVETYKANVRESLQTWLHQLKQHGRSDWMVILVETPDTKKTNKLLPRTTVLDKLKSDFGGKQTERCVSLIDPTKADSRSIESWQLLLSKMRHLIMVAYNRALNKFEEAMRSERERRTERNWSFCKYFLLQEELAQVFKMLSLYDESLVQYDELDALFTQFVLNSAAGGMNVFPLDIKISFFIKFSSFSTYNVKLDSPQWLTNFSRPCESWEGLSLAKSCDVKMQEKILSKSISLLEFRNYLFQCQASLLIQQNKPWELASRSLTFLQNTISELRILEATIMNGGIACWGFLSCLEVIQLLAKYKDPSTTDSHALHTAPLWAYARDKLKELGNLCGLMPGSKTSSEQLHVVISLVCGMGEDPHTDEHSQVNNTENVQMSPMSRIKEALSSQESFKKHFLDLSEVAISTYKHIGRIRSARLIGRDLALFYLKEGSLHQAANFLSDQLKTFVEEGWHLLSAHTQTELAKCYLETGDKERYIKTCVQLAACPVDSYKEIRVEMLNNMLEVSKNIEDEKTYSICTDRIFEIGWLKIASTDPIIMGSDVVVQLEIHSNLPVSITFDKLQMQLKQNEEKPKKAEKPSLLVHKGKSSDIERKSSSVSVASSHSSNRKHSTLSVRSSSEIGGESGHQKYSKVSSPSKQERDEEECGPKNPYLKRLNMSFHLDYKQDKSLSSVSVNCLNPHKVLRREDSLGGLDNIEKGIVKEDFSFSLATELIEVKPGKNVIELKTQVTKKGFLVGGQIVLTKDKMEFICNKSSIRGKPLLVEVISENPQIFLGRKERELLAGIPQPLILTINSGSSHIAKDTKVNLKCSRGLTLKLDAEGSLDEGKENERNTPLGFERDIEISLPEIKPFSQSILQLQALTELIPQKDASTIEHNVCITSELLEEKRLDVDIHFIPPFVASHKIHTANLRKYIQVN